MIVRRFAIVTLIAVGLLLQGGSGTARKTDAVKPKDVKADAAAVDLLERVADADKVAYRARQVVVSFGKEQSAAVLHVRSSEEGRFVRADHGGAVTRLWASPGMGVVDGTHTSKHEGRLAQVDISPRSVLAKYEVDVGPSERMLGVRLVPVALTRREDYRLTERWWIHPKSGVIYRRELFDVRGDLAGLATVIEMEWGDPGPTEPVEAEAAQASSAVRVDGADAPDRLMGNYELWRAYEIDVDGRSAEHWVYTDGLHALSVFRTEGHLEVPAGFEATGVRGLWAGPGPGTWAWEGDGSSYVVVAEEAALEPGELLRPFPKGGPGIFERLGSVWSRLFGGLGGLLDQAIGAPQPSHLPGRLPGGWDTGIGNPTPGCWRPIASAAQTSSSRPTTPKRGPSAGSASRRRRPSAVPARCNPSVFQKRFIPMSGSVSGVV